MKDTVSVDSEPTIKPQEKEVVPMETTVPALPMTVPAYGNPGYHRGLEGKDAVLIHQTQTANADRDQVCATLSASKENVIQTLETKFQAERAIKAVELAVEKTERENQQQLHSIRRELENQIKEEGVKTRAMFEAFNSSRAAVELADAKAKIMFLESQMRPR